MSLKKVFIQSLNESLFIIMIIFVAMVIIEILVLKYKERLIKISTKNKSLSYVISSFFGIIPGCIGTFTMDSLYMSGLLSFGGIIAVMIATSGDEAFLMLSMAAAGKIPWSILLFLTLLLFVLGIFGGVLADLFVKKTKMKFCEKCLIKHHKMEFNLKHFLKDHIYKHIFKKHLWKIFLWIFAAIFLISLSKDFVNPHLLFSGANLFYVFIIASVIAILPISGPNVFLIVLFSQGLVPFSILLANSIIQDGHGLLPIIGFSIDDALKIKIFNFVFGFLIGLFLLFIGL